eukprot:749465-Hanusia_phi.AAC.4
MFTVTKLSPTLGSPHPDFHAPFPCITLDSSLATSAYPAIIDPTVIGRGMPCSGEVQKTNVPTFLEFSSSTYYGMLFLTRHHTIPTGSTPPTLPVPLTSTHVSSTISGLEHRWYSTPPGAT